MYYELALISVLIAASYWGQYFVRTSPQTRTYGLMQVGAAALAGLGLYHRRVGGPDWFGLAGAIGVGTGTCLLVIGPIVRATARRFAGAERFKIAERLLDIADILAPGSGVSEEKALIAAMREIRDGNIDQTIETLTAHREQAPADARLAINERIAMLYLSAYRWDDAIAHAEKNLFGVELQPIEPPDHGWLARRPREMPGGNIQVDIRRTDGERRAQASPPTLHPGLALRRALGFAPPVWVELLGAYGYKGDLEQAARMLSRLEEVCADREDAAIWIHRGRMIFLAHAGRVAAVEALVDPRKSRHMSRGARAYWIAVAHERKGDARGAEVAYTKARSQSRGRPRMLIDRALERLAEIQAIELTPIAKGLVERVEDLAPPVVQMRLRPKPPWATRILTLAMLATAATVAIFVGDSSDLGVLVRSGAMVRGFIHNGEWWRLISCNFLHVGGLHLLVNTLGLWFLGRLCDDMFGTVRTFAIFAIAGLAGFIASDLASPVGISAGASGGIFGLLGAVFVELTLHKQHHRLAWSRGMWGSLVVVALGQFGLDVFMYSGITDQYAHLGGALGGAVMGAILSPHMKRQAIAMWIARVIAGAFGVACAISAVMVVRTPIAKSLGVADHEVAIDKSLVATAPAGWTYDDDTLHDPDEMIEFRFASSNAANPTEVFTEHEQARIHKRFDRIDIATVHVVPLPPGWTGQELSLTSDESEVGGRERYLLVIAAKPMLGGTVLVSIEITETMARAAPALLTSMLASINVK